MEDSVLIDPCQKIIAEAQRAWGDDLEKYFASVEVYRAGVFALRTGGLTSQIGIDREELIRLHGEFTEEFKETITDTAQDAMFPRVSDLFKEAATRCAEIAVDVVAAERATDAIHASAPLNLVDWIESTVSLAAGKVIGELEFELRHEAAIVCHRLCERLGEVFAAACQDYSAAISDARRRRKRIYGWAAVLVIAMGLGITTTFAFWHRPAGESIGSVIVLGTIGSILASLCAFGAVRFRDNFPGRKKIILRQHVDRIVAQCGRAEESILGGHNWQCLAHETLGARLTAIYCQVWERIDAESWQRAAVEQYERVRGLWDESKLLGQRYVSVVDSLVRDCEVYFNVRGNLEKLGQISQDVKGRAIEPTFGLLERTSREFESLRESMQGIEFW